MKTLIIIILSIIPLTCFAKRTISGKITDKNNNPIQNARVRAYDHDALNADDLMGETYTNESGFYSISYEGKNWDKKVPLLTTYRPNIFIKVSISVNGRCDDGEWNENAIWENIAVSKVYSNHRMSDDLTINMNSKIYPDNIELATLRECSDLMFCKNNFFFHYKCKACYAEKKIEWSGWGTLPYITQRCIDIDNDPDCTQRDKDDILRECNNRILDVSGAESGAQALQEKCTGTTCSQLRFIPISGTNSILIANRSSESMRLSFVAKPFKNWKRMKITHYINSNDSLMIPSIKFLRLDVMPLTLKED